MECYKCGISKDKATLYEGVYKTGIVKVCRKCFFQLKIPLIDKKKIDWSEIDSRRSVRDRLEGMTGVRGVKAERVIPREKFGLRTDDVELKDIIEKNFNREKIVSKEEPTGLIENFHWAIMRKRRHMKYTISEFSEKLREPEIIVESLEKGILPRDYEGLIKKVETLLGLRLFKEGVREIRSQDIISESKVPTGIMVSEVREKTKVRDLFFKKKSDKAEEEILREKVEAELSKIEDKMPEDDFNPEELSLETINEIVGEPIIEEKPVYEKIPFEPRYEDTNEPLAISHQPLAREESIFEERREKFEELREQVSERPEVKSFGEKINSSPLANEIKKTMNEIEDKILDDKVYSDDFETNSSGIPENVRLAMAELEAQKKSEELDSDIDKEDISRLAWGM